MHAFLINLDRSKDRLAHMEREFGRNAIPFIRVPAVDGASLGERELEEFTAPRRSLGEWLPGEVGIFLSHFAIWRRIAQSSDRAAAIFEDDVYLARDLSPLIAGDDWIPDDADLVRLESNRRMRLRSARRIAAAPNRRLYRVASGTWGAAGYIVTRRAALRLVESAPELHCPVDIFLFKPGDSPLAASLRCYQVVPAVCVQDQLMPRGKAGFRSLVGTEGRTPQPEREARSRLTRLLPWKKRPVPFRP